MDGTQSLYDAAGGQAGMLRLAAAWHERVLADEVVSHAFHHGFHPEHTVRLAAYWGEALGGPSTYTDTYGDETSVVRLHSGEGEHDEMDRRAVACFDQALADVGLTEEPLREALHDYFAWATTQMARYPDSADAVPEHLPLPGWSWDGPAATGAGDGSAAAGAGDGSAAAGAGGGPTVGAQPRDAGEPAAGAPLAPMPEGRRRAAGIYGTIITAAVLAAAGDQLPTLALAAGVLITLVVYWVAEQYAELLAEPTEIGHLPTWPRIRAGLASTWPMVTACYLPVLVLVAARLLHADASTAANLALVAAVVLLLVHGRAAGRAAGLHGTQALVAMLVTGGLGALMIVLKDLVIVVLH